METFTLNPRDWQIFRILGRNPLLRRCDRVEALVTLVAMVVVLVAIPLAGLAGSVVYTTRDRQYAQEALSHHVLTQMVVREGAGPDAAIRKSARGYLLGDRHSAYPA